MPPEIGRLQPYFVTARWEDGRRAISYQEIEKTSCFEEVLQATGGNERTAEQYESFECLLKQDDLQLDLKGLLYSDEFTYIEIDLELCEQYAGENCASAEEVETFFTGYWPYSFSAGFKN